MLKAHLYDMHIIDSASCQCGAEREDAVHYFFVCPTYDNLRLELLNTVMPFAPFNLHTLLYGYGEVSFEQNTVIFDMVHSFIRRSKRFRTV